MDVFAALADPVRRDSCAVSRGARRVVDLAAGFPISRPAISRHLRHLRDAGLVHAADHGRERHYSVRAEALAPVAELLRVLTTSGPPISDRHLDALATEVRRRARDRRNDTTGRHAPISEEEHIA